MVLAGPTAVGKGTVSRRLIDMYPEVHLSVSATTRAPRPGEKEGIHYFFVSDRDFDAMIEAGEFLEWAVVHNAYRYGTPRAEVEKVAQAGSPVLLEIDLAGARQVREVMPHATFVFLAPPSWGALVERLAGRGTEGEEERARRLETARVEMAAEQEFDVTIVNDDLDIAVQELAAVLGVKEVTEGDPRAGSGERID